MYKPSIAVLASGSEDGGGSGFENLVHASRNGILHANIVQVISNHSRGGVWERASKLGIPFVHFPAPWSAEAYQDFAIRSGAEFFALSGWLILARGLDLRTCFSPRTVFNIHPGPLPRFGGKGFHGDRVHEAVLEAYRRGEITSSAVTMHFVTKIYDDGPVIFEGKVPILKGDTVETLKARVNQQEHRYQPIITNMIVNHRIRWDGATRDSLKIPEGYSITCVA